MFTLVYIKNQFNRLENLSPFLEANIGENTLIRVDCITPYQGSKSDMEKEVCKFLSSNGYGIKVTCENVQNSSMENTDNEQLVHFLVMQVKISQN